ncbi:hypothetical protein [Kibdelosporangium philippinense]
MGAREDLWRPLFGLLRDAEVMLEFVQDDSVDAVLRDAETLRQFAAAS